jgi:hypothetical protein
MSSIRMPAAAMVLFGLMFTTAQAQLCDDRYPSTCPPQVEPAAKVEAKDIARQPQARRAAKPRSAAVPSKRVTHRKKSAPAREALQKTPARNTDAAGEKSDTSPSAKALGDQPEPVPTATEKPAMAADAVPVASQDEVNEIDLSADRLLVSPASPAKTAPLPSSAGRPISGQQFILSGPAISPPAAISVQTTTILRPAAANPAASQPTIAPVASVPTAASPPPATTEPRVEVTSSPRENPPAEMSWLRRIFLGLGGVLAVASAIRMFIG